MRVALWTPLPTAGWAAALAPELARELELVLVAAEPPAPPEADLDLYHVADAPAHGFVYRALRRRPGVVILEEWGLHRLVHAETAGRGDAVAYRREARRAHGEQGTFVARQVLRGLGGALPALVAMNERVLEASLGLVVTSAALRERAAARLAGRPLAYLPLAFLGASAATPPADARVELGLAAGQLLVLGVRSASAASPPPGAVLALERVAASEPRTRMRWTAEDAPDLALLLAAAEVVVALEYPVRQGVPPAVAAAVAAGRPTLVTAGSGVARELPADALGRVPPGRTEAAAAETQVRRLLADPARREHMGRAARAWAAARADAARAGRELVALVREVAAKREALASAAAADHGPQQPLLAAAVAELRVAARELGLARPTPDIEPLVAGLFGDGP